jgi:putative conjugative transposon protein
VLEMLLFDEQPIVYDRTLAKMLKKNGGDRAATVLQQVHYWVENNKKNKKYEAYVDGYWWTYQSIQEWYENDFNHWTYSLVKSSFKRLREVGLLIALQLSKDKTDKTNWYRINYEKLEKLYKDFKKEKEDHLLKQTNALAKNQPMALAKNQPIDLPKMNQCNKKNNKRINKENNISYHSSSNNIIYSESEQATDERLIEEDKKDISSRKKYNTQCFRDSFGYNRVSKDKQEEVDKWIAYAVDICLKIPSEEIRIGMLNITAGELRDRLLELRYEHINNVLSKLNPDIKVSNHRNYILFILYNAKEQYESRLSTSSKPASKFNNKYVAPTPEYLEKRISNRGATGERIITKEDEDAYAEMMKVLGNGKEQEDIE